MFHRGFISFLSFRNLDGLQSCDRLMSLIILPWLSLLALPIMDVGVDSKPPACLCRNNPNTLLGSSLRNCVSFPRFYPVAQSRCRCSSWLRTLWLCDWSQSWSWSCGTRSAESSWTEPCRAVPCRAEPRRASCGKTGVTGFTSRCLKPACHVPSSITWY